MANDPLPKPEEFLYTVYVGELHELFATSGIPFGTPESIFAVIDRLHESGSFSDDLGSLVRSIVLREGGFMPHTQLLEILSLAIGGTEMADAPRRYREPLRTLLGFVRGVTRRPWNVPPSDTAEVVPFPSDPATVVPYPSEASTVVPYPSEASTVVPYPSEASTVVPFASVPFPFEAAPRTIEPINRPSTIADAMLRNRSELRSEKTPAPFASPDSDAQTPPPSPPTPPDPETPSTSASTWPDPETPQASALTPDPETPQASALTPDPETPLASESTQPDPETPQASASTQPDPETPPASASTWPEPETPQASAPMWPDPETSPASASTQPNPETSQASASTWPDPQTPLASASTQPDVHLQATSSRRSLLRRSLLIGTAATIALGAILVLVLRSHPRADVLEVGRAPIPAVAPSPAATTSTTPSSQLVTNAQSASPASKPASESNLEALSAGTSASAGDRHPQANSATAAEINPTPAQPASPPPARPSPSPSVQSSPSALPSSRQTPSPALPSSHPAVSASVAPPRPAGFSSSTLPTAPGSRVTVSSGVMGTHVILAPDPEYPALARIAHVEGQVVLQAVVAKDGSVSSVRVLRGNLLLRGAAQNAVRRWRYRPYRLEGKPIDVATIVTIDFHKRN